ncbi:MAG: ABC transporter ATP-binding protein [Gemmatimonadaceae bacterium]
MIQFDAVTAGYPRAPRHAVQQVTIDAAGGALTAIVGPNGSGKSTLVRLLLRRLALASGEIAIGGRALNSYAPRELAQRVAVVPQRESAVFSLPVHEYVALGRFPHESPWRAATARDGAIVERAMDEAGVTALAGRDILALSGGEWQRARIARALAQGGDVLVLDEPTTFLDVGHEMAMFELFAELSRSGRAVLVISHQLNLIARFADTMVLLRDGRVEATGPPRVVMQAATLERVYEWPLVVTRDPAVGAPVLVPLRGRRHSSGGSADSSPEPPS